MDHQEYADLVAILARFATADGRETALPQSARDLSQVLRRWPDLHRYVGELRDEAVHLRHKEGGVRYAKIGDEIGVSPERAQQIGARYRRRVTQPESQ
jgi:hypothetical protein